MAEISTENRTNTESFNQNTSKQSPKLNNNCENNIDTNCEVKITTEQKLSENKEIKVNENDDKEEDIEIAKIDPTSRRSFINKPAYISLHRSSSLGNSCRSVSKLKERYENCTEFESNSINIKGDGEEKSEIDESLSQSKVKEDTKLTKDAVELLKAKYSPASFGYPKINSTADLNDKDSKIPLAKPRRSIKSEIHFTSPESQIFYDIPVKAGSTEILSNSSSKDENCNLLHKLNDSVSSDIEERQVILRQTPSEESVDRIAKELTHFEMDKKSKRSSSFRRIFSGGFFGKDKKKKEDEKNKLKNCENLAYTDNLQNENSTFNRQSTHRHTIGSNKDNIIINYPNSVMDKDLVVDVNRNNDLEKQYAQMHINRFNKILHNFDNQKNDDYLAMDNSQPQKKPTISDYISVPVKKYIDTSSSTTTSTTESCDKVNTYENTFDVQIKNRKTDSKINESRNSTTERKSRFNDNYGDNVRQTPPRAQETYQDFKLIKPKASIPINSERPLPNPYQNNNNLDKEMKSMPRTIERNLNKLEKNYPADKQHLSNDGPVVDDTYGTVFDSLEYTTRRNGVLKPVMNSQRDSVVSPTSPVPKSPSLEGSKLKLPPNRQIYNLQPRVKSPIPSNKVSTEKIIATELLKNSRSPTPPRKSNKTLSNQEIIESNNSLRRSDNYVDSSMIKTKPPLSPKPLNFDKYPDWQRKAKDVVSDNAIVTTNAVIHTPSPTKRSQTPTEFIELKNSSLSPVRLQTIRSSTPVDLRLSANFKLSPQKDDIRKSVEAYYWKELKKLKEQEDYELYMMQLSPNGYINEPLKVRRSRSLSPSVQRVGRRSLSLPRDVKPMQTSYNPMYTENPYGRMMPPPQSIPEGRALIEMTRARRNLNYGQLQYPPNFIRNTPERHTFNGTSKIIDENNLNDSLQRPIFKRGSLSKQDSMDFQGNSNKKVSFSNVPRNLQSWPTKNGFTQSPPQRRPERRESVVDDDVFLPNSPQDLDVNRQYNQFNYSQYGDNNVYGYSEPIYTIKANQNFDPQYGHQANVLYYQQTRPQTLRAYRQVKEPVYGQREFQPDPHKLSYESLNVYENRNQFQVDPRRVTNVPQKREIPIPNNLPEEYAEYQKARTNSQMSLARNNNYLQRENNQNPLYSSRQSVTDSISGRSVPSKQISVSNKFCDIYGQIHDQPQSGVLLGQLQRTPTSPMSNHRQNYVQQSPQNFIRGSRLTASANDMGRRYTSNDVMYIQQNFNELSAPNRPLPPIPNGKKVPSIRYPPISDTESGSDASEIQRIMNRNGKSKKRGLFVDEEWNSDGKSGRGISGNDSGRSDNEGEVRGRSRNTRRDDPRRHTLGGDQQYLGMAGQGGPLSRTMDLEGQPRGYPPPSNAMLFDDDPGIMSEVETSSTGFRRGGKQRSSLPVVRTPSKTLERPLGLVFLQYRNETKRALLPNEITSIDTVKALFVRSFPKQLTMEYLDSPNVKIYIHDSSKDMFYELEDLRSHLREIRDRSVLRLFESADVSGGLPMAGIGIAGGVGHFDDPSYFSEPEFDSEYQHQHIHKSKGSAGKAAPYYMGSTASLPRGTTLLRTYSPAVGALPAERLKSLPSGAPPKPQRAYSSGSSRSSDGPPRPPDRFAPFQRPVNPLFNVPDGYMSSPERGSRYEDPYYSQYATRSGSITPVIDEEVSDTELLDDSYSLYGVKLPPGGPRAAPRSPFPPPTVPYDATRLRVENMERQLANLTGLVQKALTQTPTTHLQVPGRDNNYRSGDEFDKNSSSSSASLPDDSYLRSDSKAPKLGKSGCHKSVSFEKSVSFSDEPPDMNSPKQHSPQHAADTKPAKPAIKSSTLPRTSSQERDRLKPAPPPKPASLSPGQYDNRLLYRDLQLTPEMYNQLRGLQKKAKDLRAEVRNLRRMSQAQAHSVRETIRDTFIKIRAMLLAGGEQVWQAGMDQERVRLSREEDLYKQEMLRLEKDLSDLESTVEELRGNVINRKTRVNMSDVENMALVLSKSSKTVADLKMRFPGLQDGMKTFLSSEMEKVMREEKFLKEEPERLESALRRCKKLTGTLVTLKRLASVQEQRLPCSNSSTDGRLSPTVTETPPITPTSSQHSKPPPGPRVGSLGIGGDSANTSDSNQRPENALDALLDELQTFSKPHPTTVSTQLPQDSINEPPAIPVKGIPPSGHPPHMSEIGRKGSMDSATFLPTQNLTVSTATGSLRRLHSYPSGSDTDNSPPIQPMQRDSLKTNANKPPIPERNTELLQHLAAGRRVPPPPPPRTSSKSPLASPTSPSLPPRSPAAGLQHIQNVQNMVDKPQSQFEAATQNLGLSTLRRNVPNRSSLKDNNKAQTLPRNIGSNLQIPCIENEVISASNSSSCESVNSQDGSKKTRKEELEQRHQELLKKQKALQEQYARLQQLQRGNNTLAVVPPTPDQLLKKTGSESNLLQKMGLQMTTSQMTGSLTNLPNTSANSNNKNTANTNNNNNNNSSSSEEQPSSTIATTNKVYETDIL